MPNKKLCFNALSSAVGVAVYVFIISFFINYADRIFGNVPGNKFLGPIAFLLTFVFSAAITGSLVLGRPIILFLDNKRAEAFKLFFCTLGWMFAILIIILLGIVL